MDSFTYSDWKQSKAVCLKDGIGILQGTNMYKVNYNLEKFDVIKMNERMEDDLVSS